MEEAKPVVVKVRDSATKGGVDGDMFHAIVNCNITKLRQALDAGARPTQLNQNGFCPLHLALHQIYYQVPYKARIEPSTRCKGHYDGDCTASASNESESSYESSDGDSQDSSSDDEAAEIFRSFYDVDIDCFWDDDKDSRDNYYIYESMKKTKTPTFRAEKVEVVPRIVELLLERGADPNCINEEEKTLLYQVIRFKSDQTDFYALKSATKLVELFFSYGACWNYDREEFRFGPFSLALKRKNGQALRLFLEHGFDLEMFNKDLRRFKSWKSFLELDVFEILARAGLFHVDSRSNEGYTALSTLIRDIKPFSIDRVKVMLDLGAKVDTMDKPTADSLMYLAAHKKGLDDRTYCELMRLLVIHGGDLLVRTGSVRVTPMAMVIRHGNWELTEWCIDRVIKNGITMDELNAICPLAYAVGHKETFYGLIMKGFDVQHEDESGSTALHSAVQNGNDIYYAKVLLQWGIDVNNVDKSGHTPLHSSCLFGSDLHTYLFLSHGANINCKTVGNKLPLDVIPHSLRDENRRKILKRIIEQIVIEESEKRPVDAQNMTYITGNLKKFYNRCQTEISRARATRFMNDLTYYDLLTSNSLERHIRDGLVYNETQRNILLNQFPVYGERMNDLLQRAYLENAFMMKARRALSRIIFGADYRSSFHPIYDPIMFNLSRLDLCNLGRI